LPALDWRTFGGMDLKSLRQAVDALPKENKAEVKRRLSGLLGQESNENLSAELKEERAAVLVGKQTPLFDVNAPANLSHEELNRQVFFRSAYLGKTPPKVDVSDDVWAQLLDSHLHPEEKKLDPLAQAARKFTGIFRLC